MRHLTVAVLILLAGCQAAEPAGPAGLDAPRPDGPAVDGEKASFVAAGKADAFGIAERTPEALGVLSLVNTTSYAELYDHARLDSWASYYIVATRAGADLTWSTADDFTYTTLVELDDVPYVGPGNFARLLAYARAIGFIDSTGICSDDRAVASTCRGTCDANKVCQASFLRRSFPLGMQATRYRRPEPSYPSRLDKCAVRACSGPWNCIEGEINRPRDLDIFDLTGMNPGSFSIVLNDNSRQLHVSAPVSYAGTAVLSFNYNNDTSLVWTLDAREITATWAKASWKRERLSYSIPLGGPYVGEGIYCGVATYQAGPIPRP